MKKIKKKYWEGLWGCDAKGFIKTPSGKTVFWLPKWWAFKLHRWLNSHSDVGMLDSFDDDEILQIKMIARKVLKEELEKAANPDA